MPSNIQEIFTEIPKRFDPAAWGPGDASLQFNITGDDGGEWNATITDGKLTVKKGSLSAPSITVTCADQDLLAIVNKELSAVSAFMQGRVKIDGDMSLAMKLQNLLT
ncbi:MAG: SCP2 sterol-binding domain-containing protein [Anaerolineae bacterium]|nr:SCP2 sterol-binding domain-containing protein [Anaerolineae bacterium]